MRHLMILLIAAVFCACKNEQKAPAANHAPEVATVEKGQELFEANNCTACHKPDQKIIGPSLQEIGQIYKAKNGDMTAFLREEAPPIVDEKLFATMKTNLQLTKTMSDEQLESLELYILGHAK